MPVTTQQKQFLVKVYKPGKDGAYLTTLNNCQLGTFSKTINAGVSNLTGRVANTFDDFEFNTVFSLNNQFKVVCVDLETDPQGKTIYSGYLESFGAGIAGSDQKVEFALVGNWTKAALHIAHSPSIFYDTQEGSALMKTSSEFAGGTIQNIAYTAEAARIDQVVRCALDYFQAADPGQLVDYRRSSELYNDPLFFDSNLKAYYRFEESGSTFADSAGADDTGTKVTGSAGLQQRIDGRFGYAYDFAGEDYVTIVDNARLKPTGNFTVSCWFLCRNVSDQGLFESYNGSGNAAGIQLYVAADGKVYGISAKNTGTLAGTDYAFTSSVTRVDDKKWHHVAFVWDGSKLYIYLDGAYESSTTWANAPVYQATNYVRMAGMGQFGSNKLDGALDDVALFNGTALTLPQIQRLAGASQLETTNKLITYTFNTRTIRNIIDRCLEFLPPFWHYYIDANNLFHLRNKEARKSKEMITTRMFKKIREAYLELYYRFEEKSGTTVTDETGGHTGTATASSILNNPSSGRFGGGAVFDRSASDAISIATTTNLVFDRNQPSTLSVWFKCDDTTIGSSQGIIQRYDQTAGARGWLLYIGDDAKLKFEIEGAQIASGFKLKSGEWYHVVLTADGTFSESIFRMFINGHYSGKTVGTFSGGGTYARLGCINVTGTNANFFDGVIDDVHYWYGYEITLEEIWNLYFDSPKHKFAIEKDISSIKVSKSMNEVRNNFLFSNGEVATIFEHYHDSESEGNFDQLWDQNVDSRVTVADTADEKGYAFIESFKREKIFVELEILDSNVRKNGYDIESIEPGDSCSISNFNQILSKFFDYNDFFITQVNYQYDRVVLKLETLRDNIAREVNLIGDHIEEADASDNDITYTDNNV